MKNDELINKSKEIAKFHDLQDMKKLVACIKELRLNINREPVDEVPCSVGLEGLAHLKSYAKTEQERAEGYAKESERIGNTTQAIAWNHTAMAYADMICEMERAD